MVKRYTTQYVKSYHYKDPNGEEEDIVFMANGYLFPIFKSFTGLELGKVLDEYKTNLTKKLSPEMLKAVAKFEVSDSVDAKIETIMQNSDVFLAMLQSAEDTATIQPGLSLIELILITMRVCAMPVEEHAEALSVGIELLPEEVYQDPQLAFELLDLAFKYEEHAKKNSTILRTKMQSI